jgi:hypothetical protein
MSVSSVMTDGEVDTVNGRRNDAVTDGAAVVVFAGTKRSAKVS